MIVLLLAAVSAVTAVVCLFAGYYGYALHQAVIFVLGFSLSRAESDVDWYRNHVQRLNLEAMRQTAVIDLMTATSRTWLQQPQKEENHE